MEGMTDLNDYSHWTFCYEAEVNDRIMMLPYLFLGKTYYAYTCFEAVPERDPRLPPINYAYSLLVGTKFGLTVSGPDYDMIAEAYFRNNLPWSYIADASILSLTEQDGPVYSSIFQRRGAGILPPGQRLQPDGGRDALP